MARTTKAEREAAKAAADRLNGPQFIDNGAHVLCERCAKSTRRIYGCNRVAMQPARNLEAWRDCDSCGFIISTVIKAA